MYIHQRIRRDGQWDHRGGGDTSSSQLALVFSNSATLADPQVWHQLRAFYPAARIVACSTAGEIDGTEVYDETLTCTALTLAHTAIVVATVSLEAANDNETLGSLLCSQLPKAHLAHVLVFSDGLKVNGSALLLGMTRCLPADVRLTGGLAADGSRFQTTAVCVDGPQTTAQVAAVGLYGSRLRVGYGSKGGWDSFGVERRITKSQDNVLYELDGEPALDLYKRYLGDKVKGLPATGLRFPLEIRDDHAAHSGPMVRTILGINEADKTLTFAGDVPVGYRARLMSANLERLLDGARAAAIASCEILSSSTPELAILISCVGRKLLLKQRVEEEIEAVREVIGDKAAITGFYSYGELSPSSPSGPCQLHNQTMTITTLQEW